MSHLYCLKSSFFFLTKPSSKSLFIIFYLTHVMLSLHWFDLCIFYLECDKKLQCTGIGGNFIKQVYFNIGFISRITISCWWEVCYFIIAPEASQKCFEMPRKGKSVRCILTVNTSTGGLTLKRDCSYKFKNTFKIASTSINLYVFVLNILTLN